MYRHTEEHARMIAVTSILLGFTVSNLIDKSHYLNPPKMLSLVTIRDRCDGGDIAKKKIHNKIHTRVIRLCKFFLQ